MKLTLEEIADKVDQEDLGYSILHYYGRKVDSENQHFNYLWKEAYDALTAVEEMLPKSGED
jgi:hypothetical protein